MSMGPRLELRHSQQLVMTPQLQLAIKLLTLTNLELETFISDALDKNPLLTTADSDGPIEAPTLDPTPPLETDGLDALLGREPQIALAEAPLDLAPSEPGGRDEGEGGGALVEASFGGATGGAGGEFDLERLSDDGISLRAHLALQAGMKFDGTALVIAEHLIDLIDESGYLTEPLDQIAARLGMPITDVAAVLADIQRFDPTGVGARSLAECMALQAQEADRHDPAMAALIVNLHLVGRGDIAALMRVTACGREDVMDMIRELRSYDPKPGLRFGGETAAPVVADVFVRRVGNGWRIELNQATLPRLIIDRDYHAVLAADGSKATGSFLNECLADANWLLKALDQRARTIIKVASALVVQQAGFFETGVAALKPLTLRQIADAIEMHESTVSRVAANKYLACDRGLFELRWFFSSGVASSGGVSGEGGASAVAVKDRIARLIAAEGASVLSDDSLVEILQSEGFDIARRTVAKYREALGLGSSVARRRARTLATA